MQRSDINIFKTNNMISVILPAYNAQETIGTAIQSIINQTYKDWELLVINDGSTDNTKSIILSFADSRVKYIENDGNKQLIYTLNRGLEIATGEYVARMDSDDIAHPSRFMKQIQYLEENPKCIVCGTEIMPFRNGRNLWFLPKRFRYDDKGIKSQLLRTSCFAHPTVMIRASVLRELSIRYNPEYKHAEDYKLWIDLMDYGLFHNINERLLKYRISPTQVTSNKNNQTQMEDSIKRCRKEAFFKLLNNDAVLSDLIFGDSRNYENIREIKKIVFDPIVRKELCYCVYTSLTDYSLQGLFYFFLSGDWLKYDILSVRHICRLFLR